MKNKKAYVGTQIHIPVSTVNYGIEARKYPDHCDVALENFVNSGLVIGENIFHLYHTPRYIKACYTMIDGIIVTIGANLKKCHKGLMLAIEVIVVIEADDNPTKRPFDTRSTTVRSFDKCLVARSER